MAPTISTPRRCFLLLLSLFFFSCTSATRTMPGPVPLADRWFLQDAAKISAGPEQVSLPDFSPAAWHRAIVPGTVLTSLVADGTYPDPLYGENNRPDRIPESLARASYWYRTTFTAPPVAKGRHLWLLLDGINYLADLWIDGHHVGDMRGAFVRGQFDITPFVTPGIPAALAIHIFPPPHPGNPLEQTVANGTGPNGGILAEDGPTFLCTIGWDWIPAIRDRDIGIWQKVSLAQSGPVLIENPLITSTLPLPRTDSADLTLTTTLRNLTDARQSGTLHATLGDVTIDTPITLAPHTAQKLTLTPQTAPQLHLQNPRLWWPNGYGPQNLYPLHLDFTSKNAQLSDTRDLSFGIRQITYHVTGSESLTLSVNGVPIVCKGGDWGMDEAMKRIPRERLDAQIRMHQFANYTMIRNWVGQSTSEDFYDLCDRYGILIWDECFQPNPSDGPNPLDVDLYLANVREKVLRFRNHPCIAVWCARNEGNPPPAIDAGIRTIMDELEPARLYQKNSADGRGVRSGGPYAWREPRQFYQFPPTEAFKTEIGSVSMPTLQSIEAMMPEKDWWPLTNDGWAEHDLLKGAQQGDTFPRKIAQRYGPSNDLPDFVRKSHLATYEAFRAMYEGRFAKLFHPVTGVITWMSNPAQPSVVWQLYSHDLEPTAALFATRNACEPLHIMMNQATGHLVIVNATPDEQPHLHARVRIFDLHSKMLDDQTLPVAAPASASADLGLIDLPPEVDGVHFLKLELFDEHEHLVSENFYWNTIPPPPTTAPATRPNRPAPTAPENFQALQSLPQLPLSLTVTRTDTSPRATFTATLTNPTTSIALLAHLQLRNASTSARILPAYYSDNFITLLPHETRTITIDAATKDLGISPATLALDGFNVLPAQSPALPKK